MNDGGAPGGIREHLWEFPHEMTLKVFGDADAPLADIVCAILARHLGEVAPRNLGTRPSSGGRYVAVSVDICVHNRAQVEGIYADLAAHPRVRMAI
jgi:putative lipoic acid-binding regulatory protein